MLGVGAWVWQEVSQMPTPHSWAARIMSLESEQMDEAVERVDVWIQKTMLQENPQSGQAERIVREMWPAVMEREAIEAYIAEHPFYVTMLPVVDPADAAGIGAIEIMANDEEQKIAEQFLEEMLEGIRVPPHVKS